MSYKKLVNNDDDAYCDSDDNIENDIQPLYNVSQTSIMNNTLLNEIVQHPYIDSLSYNLKELTKCKDKQYLVVYRIHRYGWNNVVEFHLIDKFRFVEAHNHNDIFGLVRTILHDLQGIKHIKGHLNYNDEQYLFIQIRDNDETKNWMTIWDIIVNKHYFGKEINDTIVDFFAHNCEISNLIMGSSALTLLKPIILYTNIHERYFEHVKQTRSIQYCYDKIEPLIRLRKYKQHDNVRTICFINDKEFSNGFTELAKNQHVILKIENEEQYWVFKNETNIFSFVK